MSCLRFRCGRRGSSRVEGRAITRRGFGIGWTGKEWAELSRQSCSRSGRHRLATFESPAQQRETLVEQAFAIRLGGTVGGLELERGDDRRDRTRGHEVWVDVG